MDVDQTVLAVARKHYQRLLHAAVRGVARTGLRPNALTIASLPPALLAGIAAAGGALVTAAILLLASGMLDLLDGALARETRQTSRFGALLDSSIDRLSDAAVLAGLTIFYAPHGKVVIIPVAAILSGFIIPYVRARAEALDIRLPRLWMRREDRLVMTVVALLASSISLDGTAIPAPATLAMLAVLAVLGFVAATMALVAASRHCRTGDLAK